MIPVRVAGAVFVQAIAFVGPLAAALAGLISGELAGLAAPVCWFGAGIPLSYRVLDRRPAKSHGIAHLSPEARRAAGAAQVAPGPTIEAA